MTDTSPAMTSYGFDSSSLVQLLFNEGVVRGSLLILFCALLIMLFAGRSAANRSILWLMLICALALMPVFSTQLPALPVALNVDSQPGHLLASLWWQSQPLLAGQAPHWSWLLPLLAGLYLSVLSAGLLYLLAGTACLLQITRRARALDDPAILAMVDSLCSSNGIHCRVTLFYSDQVQSPLTWGLFRHRILLPSAASGWRQDLLAQALSHELAHIQRMDWVSHMLSRLVLCAYWFNPLAWWLHRRFVEESEMACDEAVIDDTGCAVTYAENLLWFANSLGTRQSCVASQLLRSRSALYRRVAYILHGSSYRSVNGRSGLVAGLLFAIVLVAPVSALRVNFVETEIRKPETFLIPVSYFPRGTPDHERLLSQFRHAGQ